MGNLNKGFIYIWALFAVALTGVLMAAIGQAWQAKLQREKEQELLFVGDQIRKAITSYYEGSAGAGGSGVKQFPESLEKLILDTRSPVDKRHLRKLYRDPMTNSIEWGLISEPKPEKRDGEGAQSSGPELGTNPGVGTQSKPGIIGVYSLSEKIPLKSGNFPLIYIKFAEAATYQDWQFVYTPGSNNNTASKPNSPPSALNPSSPFSTPSGSDSSEAPSSSPFSSGSNAPAQSGINPFAPR